MCLRYFEHAWKVVRWPPFAEEAAKRDSRTGTISERLQQHINDRGRPAWYEHWLVVRHGRTATTRGPRSGRGCISIDGGSGSDGDDLISTSTKQRQGRLCLAAVATGFSVTTTSARVRRWWPRWAVPAGGGLSPEPKPPFARHHRFRFHHLGSRRKRVVTHPHRARYVFGSPFALCLSSARE